MSKGIFSHVVAHMSNFSLACDSLATVTVLQEIMSRKLVVNGSACENLANNLKVSMKIDRNYACKKQNLLIHQNKVVFIFFFKPSGYSFYLVLNFMQTPFKIHQTIMLGSIH